MYGAGAMANLRRSVSCAAVALILAGCTSGADEPVDSGRVVQLGAPGETGRELAPEEIAELEQHPEIAKADTAFVQGMIRHHEQALAMTELVSDRTTNEDLHRFAERIEISQLDEIAQMEQWLHDRRVLESDHDDHALMPGMLTEIQFGELDAASGDEFDRLFLEYMIQHHEGALTMVKSLLEGGYAQDPALYQIVSHVDGDQRIEINRMTRMLSEAS
jgi:uncharacterized protein (DUF305 family)